MNKLKQLLFIIALFFSLSATADTLDTITVDEGYADNIDDNEMKRIHHEQLMAAGIMPEDIVLLQDSMLHSANDAERIVSKYWARNDMRSIEVLLLMNFVLEMPIDSTRMSREDLYPLVFQLFYTTKMENRLYMKMGGNDEEMSQVISALSINIGQMLSHTYCTKPDQICARIDSVASYFKRIDYLGKIYQENHMKPIEYQRLQTDSLVMALPDLKESIRALSAKYYVATPLFTKLYQGDICFVKLEDNYTVATIKSISNGDSSSVRLEDYFTPELCQKIKDGKLDLSIMAPKKDWSDWQQSDSESYSFIPDEDDYINVIFSSPKEYSRIEADKKRTIVELENTYKVIYVKFDNTPAGYRISNVKNQDEYMQETYGSLVNEASEGYDVVMPD